MSEVVRLYQYKSLLVGRRAMSAEDLIVNGGVKGSQLAAA